MKVNMRLLNLKKYIIIFGLLIISSTSVLLVAAETTITDGDSYIIVDITDAFYTNADDNLDGIENDVLTLFTLDINQGEDYLCFTLHFSLTLPSGTKYFYHYLIDTNASHLSPTMYFYNHATESGWYDVRIWIVLFSNTISWGTEGYTFDPPGGSPGTDPPMATLDLGV